MHDELSSELRRWADATDPADDPISGAEVRERAAGSDDHAPVAIRSRRRTARSIALAAAAVVVVLGGTAIGLRGLGDDVRVETADDPANADRSTTTEVPDHGRWPECDSPEDPSPWPGRPTGPDVAPDAELDSTIAEHVSAALGELEPDLAPLVQGAEHEPACLLILGNDEGVLVLLTGSRELGYRMATVVAPVERSAESIGVSASQGLVSVSFDTSASGAEDSCEATLAVRYGDQEASVTEVSDGTISLSIPRDEADAGAITLTLRSSTGELVEFRAFQVPPGDFAAG